MRRILIVVIVATFSVSLCYAMASRKSPQEAAVGEEKKSTSILLNEDDAVSRDVEASPTEQGATTLPPPEISSNPSDMNLRQPVKNTL